MTLRVELAAAALERCIVLDRSQRRAAEIEFEPVQAQKTRRAAGFVGRCASGRP
jgi:hypothetical protein